MKKPTETIKDILKERGLTQTDLARMTNTSLQNVRQLLAKDSLKVSTLQTFADALGIEMWELFASREDVIGDGADEMTVTCPHCGKPVTIKGVVK